jgi:hypothetical protein
VGIDTGSGGTHGPLFADGSFELIPIPDGYGRDERTYGNTWGRRGRPYVEYFRGARRARMAEAPMHVDPEFESFTYGTPAPAQSSLRRLEAGDLLVFYCGLQGWDVPAEPALYIAGYFEVGVAGRAADFGEGEIGRLFAANMHVRHREVFEEQRERLVLVKGTDRSRLLGRAVRISAVGRTRTGRPTHVLSEEMQAVFGDLGGRPGIQRSPARWVDEGYVDGAAAFLRGLE